MVESVESYENLEDKPKAVMWKLEEYPAFPNCLCRSSFPWL